MELRTETIVSMILRKSVRNLGNFPLEHPPIPYETLPGQIYFAEERSTTLFSFMVNVLEPKPSRIHFTPADRCQMNFCGFTRR